MSNCALLVGVNKYENGNNLRGCCNDVDDVEDILINHLKICGKQDITILKDESATTENILKTLRSMATELKPGDFGFFHFSGHGSQAADISGDEPDGKDELICPHDMNWWGNKYITDDTLADIFKGISDGAWLEVIIDACHSGTVTKSIDIVGTPKTITSPYYTLNVPVRRMREAIDIKRNHVLWSGCEDDQTSADTYIDGHYRGAFTYYWSQAIRENKNRPRHELLKRIRFNLINNGYGQIPQLAIL